jgi:hypothetical protein
MIEQTFRLKKITTVTGSGRRARRGIWVGPDGGGEIQMATSAARRAALSSAWSQPETVGSAPKIFTRRTVPEGRVTDRPARLTGATPTTTTRSRLPSAPGIGPATPSHLPSSAPGRSLPLVRGGASVGDRAVAGVVSRHGAAPGATALSLKCERPRSSSRAQSGRHQSAFQDHSLRIITLHPANGNRCWPTASADISTSTSGAQVDRLAPLQSAARSRSQWRHTRLRLA